MIPGLAEVLSAGEGSRPDLWAGSLKLVPVYPVFGAGLGGYESAFYQYKNVLAEFMVDYAHNDYLQLLIELGAVGFLIGAVLIAAIVRSVVRTAANHPRSEEGALAIACAGALAAFLIHSFYNFNFYAPANALMAACVAGISTGLSPSGEDIAYGEWT